MSMPASAVEAGYKILEQMVEEADCEHGPTLDHSCVVCAGKAWLWQAREEGWV